MVVVYMAKIKENLKIECRNIEEYYELMERYKKSRYAIKEEDYHNPKNLNFFATRENTIWE